MRVNVTVGLAILMLCAIAPHARATEETGAPLPADASVDVVLDALDARGHDLKAFVASVSLEQQDNVMGTSTTKTGRVWYQSRGEGDVRIHVLFEKAISDVGPASPERQEYLLDKNKLIDRNHRGKTEVTREIAKAGEKVNLFQLGKGPFPLPIGQKKEDVHGQFDVKKLDVAKDDPANSIHLQLVPHSGTELARKFSSIDLWADCRLKFPIRIETLDADGNIGRVTRLNDLTINPQPGLADSDFALPNIDNETGWNRSEENLPQ